MSSFWRRRYLRRGEREEAWKEGMDCVHQRGRAGQPGQARSDGLPRGQVLMPWCISGQRPGSASWSPGILPSPTPFPPGNGIDSKPTPHRLRRRAKSGSPSASTSKYTAGSGAAGSGSRGRGLVVRERQAAAAMLGCGRAAGGRGPSPTRMRRPKPVQLTSGYRVDEHVMQQPTLRVQQARVQQAGAAGVHPRHVVRDQALR